MIKRITKPLLASIFFVGLLLGGYSCANDDYLSEREIQNMINESLDGQWQVMFFKINKGDWTWNENSAQWEAFGNLPELTPFIYENGILEAYVFILNDDSEVQKHLPYVETYGYDVDENDNVIPFTETISVDYQLGSPSTVGFFIKDSQLVMDPDAPQDYEFRIVLLQ